MKVKMFCIFPMLTHTLHYHTKIRQLLLIMFCFKNCLSYDPTIVMPYKKISTTSDLNIIGNTLNCSQTRSNIQTCAENCFNMDLLKQNCLGFLKDGSGGKCYLCNVINREEVNSNLYTTFTESQTLYLLKVPNVNPNVYISMEDYDINTKTITGYGVSGTSPNIGVDDLITGKVGQGIKFGGWMTPGVSQPECYCSFYYCNGTMSLSFWGRSRTTALKHVITPPSGRSVSWGTGSGGWFRAPGISMGGYGE